MNHDIFISYSSKQKSIADGVCHYLEENGFKCWMAPRDIPVGSEYGDLIEEAIKACKVVVLVFSEASSISKWVKGEINVAFTENKVISPFRVDETEVKGGLRVMLNQMHWIDAFPHYADRLPDLLKSIYGLLGRPAKKADTQRNTTRIEEQESKQDSPIVLAKKSTCPEGAINGIFSVSSTNKVFFSKGNLQYQASTGIWRFAEKQYDIVGLENKKISSSNTGWIDLFGWGTGDEPIKVSTKDLRYRRFVDWGHNSISNGGGVEDFWRTLTIEEWRYVIEMRVTMSNWRFAKASVNEMDGVILFPDDWKTDGTTINDVNDAKADSNSNLIPCSRWKTMEQNGAVFLPAAGWRQGINVGVNHSGSYWSASGGFPFAGDFISFITRDFCCLETSDWDGRWPGKSVRLVCSANKNNNIE